MFGNRSRGIYSKKYSLLMTSAYFSLRKDKIRTTMSHSYIVFTLPKLSQIQQIRGPEIAPGRAIPPSSYFNRHHFAVLPL